jgi:hypothetical protein
MRDCVVVGCGRSGTSLAAGLLAHAGYDCGEDLLPPDDGAPTGFFEARGVNRINELLLAPHDDVLRRDGYSRRLRDGERWLAVLPDNVEVEVPPGLRGALSRALPASPYCCKDPRFGYTLGAWRPFLGEPLFVCVFRHPLATATSIARDVRYGDLTVDRDVATAIWTAIYRRVLGRHRNEGDWLFVHYEQLLDGSGVQRLADAVGTPLDPGLADPALRRARPDADPPPATAPIYEELCALAGCAA